MPRNCADFHIIGQVGSLKDHNNVLFVNVASNYNRQVDGEWKQETSWNRVTCFGKYIEYARDSGKGDLVRITGQVKQSSYEKDGEIIYGTDLIADSYSVLSRTES